MNSLIRVACGAFVEEYVFFSLKCPRHTLVAGIVAKDGEINLKKLLRVPGWPLCLDILHAPGRRRCERVNVALNVGSRLG